MSKTWFQEKHTPQIVLRTPPWTLADSEMLRLHCFRIVELWGLHQGWKIQFVLLWRYVLSLFKYLTIHKCIVPYSPEFSPSLLLVSTLFPFSSYSANSSSCPAKGPLQLDKLGYRADITIKGIYIVCRIFYVRFSKLIWYSYHLKLTFNLFKDWISL